MPVDSASPLKPVNNVGTFSNQSLHDITLQTLETRHPHPDYPEGVYYSVDNFEGTEAAWESKDIVVFVPPGQIVEHVTHSDFANDPLCEANRRGYRIVGRLNNTLIGPDEQGKPQVKSQILIDDPEVKKYADKKQLALSSAFDSVITPDGKLSGKVVPNHVLLFLKCAGKSDGFCGIPNDKGSGLNNLAENKMTEDLETKGMLTKIFEAVSHKPAEMVPVENVADLRIAELTVKIEALSKENAALKDSKAALDNLMAEKEILAKDARWLEVKNLHQAGLFHKELEATERAAFDKDNAGWLMAHVGNLATVKAAPAKGVEAVGNLSGDDKPFNTGDARGTLNIHTGRFE